MKIAVIKTGGKQYVVSEGQQIQVEKLPHEKGAKFDFDTVLMVVNGDKVEIGKPNIASKKVSAELVEQKRKPKVTILRYHSKTRYRKLKGHKQPISVVKILGIK
jgi:large subunit ribosomal protein L21